LAAGEAQVTFVKARWIEQVWIAPVNGQRRELTVCDIRWLRKQYPDVPLSAVTRAAPQYWAIPIVNLAPEQVGDEEDNLEAAGLTDLDFLQYGDLWLTDVVMIMPPADMAYTVEVLARWRYHELSDDDDVSFWSMAEPDILVAATKVQLELNKHRNETGQMQFEKYCLAELKRLEHELASENAAGPPERFRMFGRPRIGS
jgi:hypothetical protein